MVVQHKGLVRKGNEKACPEEGWSGEAALYTWLCILLCEMKMKLPFNSYVGVSLYFSCPTRKLQADKAEQGQRQEIQTRKPRLFCSLDLEFRSMSTPFFWAEIPRLATRGRSAARKHAPRNSPAQTWGAGTKWQPGSSKKPRTNTERWRTTYSSSNTSRYWKCDCAQYWGLVRMACWPQ